MKSSLGRSQNGGDAELFSSAPWRACLERLRWSLLFYCAGQDHASQKGTAMESMKIDVRATVIQMLEKRVPGSTANLADTQSLTKPPFDFDSLEFLDAIAEVSERLDVQLDDKEDFRELVTVGRLIERFEQLSQQKQAISCP
jgi:acyl carrier protein